MNNSSANIGIRLGVSGFNTPHRGCKYFTDHGGGQNITLEEFQISEIVQSA